jgi:hypothetical protein
MNNLISYEAGDRRRYFDRVTLPLPPITTTDCHSLHQQACQKMEKPRGTVPSPGFVPESSASSPSHPKRRKAFSGTRRSNPHNQLQGLLRPFNVCFKRALPFSQSLRLYRAVLPPEGLRPWKSGESWYSTGIPPTTPN